MLVERVWFGSPVREGGIVDWQDLLLRLAAAARIHDDIAHLSINC